MLYLNRDWNMEIQIQKYNVLLAAEALCNLPLRRARRQRRCQRVLSLTNKHPLPPHTLLYCTGRQPLCQDLMVEYIAAAAKLYSFKDRVMSSCLHRIDSGGNPKRFLDTLKLCLNSAFLEADVQSAGIWSLNVAHFCSHHHHYHHHRYGSCLTAEMRPFKDPWALQCKNVF